ncbi:MAG: hypothetical protein KAQ67_08825 [Gammaproteobacteria bacterium]|nr:hypothetical protein [Gammaproteobacteria bacterium]
MNKKTLRSLFVVLLLALVIVGNYFLRKGTDNNQVEYSKCQLGIENCLIVIDGMELEIIVEGEIKALKPFVIHMTDKNQIIDKALVKFNMKAMDMGVNQYEFIQIDHNNWKAKVVIPVCTTGRRDWLVEFVIDNEIKNKNISFEIEI